MRPYILSVILFVIATFHVIKATITGVDPKNPHWGILQCEPCSLDKCRDATVCKGGKIPDVCNCCKVCTKVENEICGGKWYMWGKCDKGLYCDVSGGTWSDPKGICRKSSA
uniref:Toxin candidate TRINITY_DN30832_c1_g1_i1 n=1 Tax=Pachycerianthus maua TaxID=2736681 RepID=A0A7G7WZ79_9CNID|nr:toxin candidate TRINITY_DN30832_c1_g1_i1 [Pachycerianthus maua]